MHEGRLGLGKPHLPGHVQATEPLWPAHVEHPVLQGCSPADHRPHSGDDVLQTMFQLTAEQMVINSIGGSAGGSLLTAIGLLLPRIKHAEQDETHTPLAGPHAKWPVPADNMLPVSASSGCSRICRHAGQTRVNAPSRTRDIGTRR